MKWLYWGIVAVVLAAVIVYEALTFTQNFPAPEKVGSVTLMIQKGATLHQIARRLYKEGVLRNPWKLKLLAKAMRKERALQPGEYVFDTPTPPLKILDTLGVGRVILHRVTFPEGTTVKEMGDILEQAGIVSRKEFEYALQDQSLIRLLDLPNSSFEGFLFPETYMFSRTDGPRKIIRSMVAHFHKALSLEDHAKAKALGFSLLEWVTLASIIEAESTLPREHKIISSVFHNRLKKKMRLESDPTVIYGIPDFDGNLRRKDLETYTPYNTYRIKGLPPGPIANPGASALHAAVNPDSTDYYFFVADKKGAHVFAKTYEEHLENVRVYQLNRRRRVRRPE